MRHDLKEKKRIETLEKLRILDTPAEQAYDDIVLLASKLMRCSTAIISLVDGERLWFKAKIGTSSSQAARVGSFCDTAVQENQILVVSDARQDARFSKSESVATGLRFYASIPLTLNCGETVGALCVQDHEPRTLIEGETALLQVLARQVVGELERRRVLFQLEEATQSVRIAESKYRNLVQLSPAGIFQTDALGNFVFVSERWQRIAGLTLEEAIHSGWENAVHPDDKAAIFKEWLASDAESRPFRCEYRIQSPKGTLTWVNAESDQIRDENGVITGYLGALQDITNLKHTEEQLLLAQAALESRVEESAVEFQILTDSIRQLVWHTSPGGEFLYLSPTWMDLTGVAVEKIQWEGVIHPEDISIFSDEWSKCLSTGSNFEIEYRIKLKDDTYRWFLARGIPKFGKCGKITKWFGTATDIEIQKQAVKKANLAEQKLSHFLTAIPMILWATDKNGIVTLSEGKGLASLGLKPGETVGWDMLCAQQGGVESVRNVRRALAGETFDAISHFESRIVETRYSPLLDSNGKPSGMVAISNDVTERATLENALRESENHARDSARKLETVLQNAPIALTEINRDGIITYSDGKYLISLGIKTGELVGQSSFELHKEDPARLDSLKRTFNGETVTAPFQNGSSWVLATTTPFTQKNGEVNSVLSLAIDITEKMTAENQIRASESRFRKVCESKLFGMLFWDKNGAIIDSNDTLVNMIGYTRADLTAGRLSWKDITPPEYAEIDANAVAETLTHGYCEPYEKEFIRKDGSRIAIIISGATIFGEDDTGGIALVIDVSAKKLAEKEKSESILNERAAVHASKTKSQFLANMSHEIRTPINGVIGMVGLLLDTPLELEQRGYAEAARVSADSLLTVINDILDFSKIEAGKLDFENIDFDILVFLKNVELAFTFEAQRKNLKLLVNFDENIPRFYNGDSGRLRQVLTNLLSNAIKFTSNGQITVDLSRDPVSGHLKFRITDTGLGIPASALNRMFKAFSQADSSTARRFGGTGLGLSICKHLVEHMHGTIGVDTKENEGSTFWFTVDLPAAKNEVQEVRESAGTFFSESTCEFPRYLTANRSHILSA